LLGLSSLSSKLWDILSLATMTLFHLTVWETRTYHSNNASTQSECEKIIERVAQSYWICTGSRVYLNDALIPTGYVVGKNGYLVWCQVAEGHGSRGRHEYGANDTGQTQLLVQVIGWWSVKSLVSHKIETACIQHPEYRIVSQHPESFVFVKSWDDFDPEHFHTNCAQAVDIVRGLLSTRNTGVFFLYGDPGLGKTTTARLLAKQLDAWLCQDFEELYYSDVNPVGVVKSLVHYIQPTAEQPLILVLDEVDEFLFARSYDDDEEEDKDAPARRFRNRTTKKNWGRFLDSVQQSRNIVLFLTSNRPKSYFDAFDNALLRSFRVTACLHYREDGIRIDDDEPVPQYTKTWKDKFA